MLSSIVNMENKNKTAILLCTYNGERYLREQIDSIISQSYNNWCLFVSDDGSSDSTIRIVQEYQSVLGSEKLKLVKGPGKGFASNFMSLTKIVPEDFDYYAFSDQDDIWLKDKLLIAIAKLEENKTSNMPKVYCGRTTLVDEKNNTIGKSPLFTKAPSLKNALVQSIAGGNTMMLNKKAFTIVSQTPEQCEIVSHDWWIYIITSAAGGQIIYDANPTIRYRQHTGNLVGSNSGWYARCTRLMGLLKGRLKCWNQKNIDSLLCMSAFTTNESKEIINAFVTGRQDFFIKRLFVLMRLGLYRQTLAGTMALYFAIFLNKI